MDSYRARSAQRRQAEIMKRVVILAVVMFLLLLVIILILPERTASAKNEPSGSYCILSVEVEEGDSLWSIASAYFTEDFGSIQSYISEIKRMNSISSDTLYTGAYILVPYYQ